MIAVMTIGRVTLKGIDSVGLVIDNVAGVVAFACISGVRISILFGSEYHLRRMVRRQGFHSPRNGISFLEVFRMQIYRSSMYSWTLSKANQPYGLDRIQLWKWLGSSCVT